MMSFEPKRYLGLILLYMVATGGCKPAADPTQAASRSALPHGRNRLTGRFYRPGPRRLLLPGRTSRSLGDPDKGITGPKRGASVTGESGHNRENRRWMSVSPRPSNDDCIAGKVEAVTSGRVFISGQLEVISPNPGYQADSAFPGKMASLSKTTGIVMLLATELYLQQ